MQEQDKTRTVASGSSFVSRPATSTPAGEGADEGRFLPGQIISDRYRIISLLGAGGMGEVYRATDLKLGQAVALKFLPSSAPEDALHRFRGEVRVTRQISHPNVCRVYDIGEVDGQTYLSMEYVDGEDLASLLRRIGRLPPDKAIDIARQVCAGLAAAHDKGVLHRDLKPSNILLDSRGMARVADFGLAAEEQIRAGTPAYMAPEQFAGREITVRSDIYALGLVLYELFTGKRALTSPNTPPGSPSTVLPDIEPAVETVIMRCLEDDPAQRPPTALAVSAALPGGDPLAAALAAGETPSPALIAAAGQATGIKPIAAAILFGVLLAALTAIWFVGAGVNQANFAGLERSPDVMAQRARDIAAALGYPDRPFDLGYGYSFNQAFDRYRREAPNAKADLYQFWYRQSPEALLNLDAARSDVVTGDLRYSVPPADRAGMINLMLDHDGRLIAFQAVTPEKDPGGTTVAPDWNAILKSAGMDPSKYQQTEPQWLSDGISDARAAWTGKDENRSSEPIRIEAAAFRGKLVQLRTIMPWTRPSRSPAPESEPGSRFRQAFGLSVLLIMMVAAVFMARRNLLAGRGDRNGASRLAAAVFVIHLIAFVLGAHHVTESGEIPLVGIAVAIGLLKAALLWVGYVALEPFARRRWSHTLISWSRLLDGRWSDPLVGRDVLFGLAFGTVSTLFIVIVARWDSTFSITPTATIQSVRTLFAAIVNLSGGALLSTFGTFLLLFLLRLLARRDWIAVLLGAVIFSLPNGLAAGNPALGFALGFVMNFIAFALLARAGLTALLAFLWTLTIAGSAPFTTDTTSWYFSHALLMAMIVAGIGMIAFRHALAGRPVFADAH